MKTTIIIIIAAVVVIGAGYFGTPFLIDKNTSGLKQEVQDLKQRLKKIEEEARVAPLKPDADARQIIKTVNAILIKINTMEESFKKEMSLTEGSMKKQKAETEEVLKKEADTIDKLNKETKEQLQKIKFDAAMATIRGHILKVRGDLSNKNIGIAKAELDLIADAFESAKTAATTENKKIIEDYQGILKKVRTEIDTDLPSAMNKVDLLWHEMSKMLRKA